MKRGGSRGRRSEDGRNSPLRGFEGSSDSEGEEKTVNRGVASTGFKVVCRKRSPCPQRRRPHSEISFASFQPAPTPDPPPRILALRSLLRRTEHIPLLDESDDSSGSEAEAKHVLETLHLRFSPEPQKTRVEPQQKPGIAKNAQIVKVGRKGKWGVAEKPVACRSKSPLIPERKSQSRRGAKKSPVFPQFTRKPRTLTKRRTIDKGAFLLVSNRQCSTRLSPYGQAKSGTFETVRPTSAGTLLGWRLLRRPNSALRCSNR